MLAQGIRLVYASGECEIDLARRELRVLGSPVPVGGRAFVVIEVLARSAGEIVTKDELLSRVWPGLVVAEENLKVQVSALRKALGEDRDFIRTEFGLGYRFTAAVRSTVAWDACQRPTRPGHQSSQRSLPRRISRRPPHDRRVSRSLRQTF